MLIDVLEEEVDKYKRKKLGYNNFQSYNQKKKHNGIHKKQHNHFQKNKQRYKKKSTDGASNYSVQYVESILTDGETRPPLMFQIILRIFTFFVSVDEMTHRTIEID
jgi:hypothetical protein